MYPAPPPAPATTSATLDLRYQATAREIKSALATAQRIHDSDRTHALTAFISNTRRRQFLSFDPRGRGRVVEVLGDLRHADRIAVVVPGADNSLANYDSPKFAGGGSRALYRQARATAPGTQLAVIAWLGYDSPGSLSTAVLSSERAEQAAPTLRRLLTT
ncbi:hypothetical protein E1264_17185, partial [Actinomadura sp. KC216]